MRSESSSLFHSFAFDKGLVLRNRAQGVGMVITGCTHVTENGLGFTDAFAAWDDRFIPGLRQLAQAARSGGAPAQAMRSSARMSGIWSMRLLNQPTRSVWRTSSRGT